RSPSPPRAAARAAPAAPRRPPVARRAMRRPRARRASDGGRSFPRSAGRGGDVRADAPAPGARVQMAGEPGGDDSDPSACGADFLRREYARPLGIDVGPRDDLGRWDHGLAEKARETREPAGCDEDGSL